MKTILSRTALAILLIATTAFGSSAYALDDKQKEEFGAFIKEYLIAHPEVLLDAQAALEQKQEAARAAQTTAAVTQNKQEIFHSKDDVSLGNPQGDVSVVEFFDYNCGYCRHALPDMETMLKKDKNIRFVLKEFPILGPDSVAAHRVSDAFRQLAPEKYPAYFRSILGSNSRATEQSAIDDAAAFGVTEAALRKTMKANTDDTNLKQTYALAQKLAINGTPAYIIGDEVISGAIGAEALQQKVANVRACGKTTCS
ncbi:DsbA family protein [Rhizobium oryziradicis]|uniref:Disulfide bond formation protein DsbA n=1 Tax=Rhizobium oryziradicis TaxID=1867956 RepID=A0A1Q8ZMZ7_9HYPH|nr:DsbA family protein [Rhizobium oryziradicis]OLP43280.1 disulfide bond formation protein DsbA [Rhizobium oryziradicis]